MKKLTLSFLILISLNCFGQNSEDSISKSNIWYICCDTAYFGEIGQLNSRPISFVEGADTLISGHLSSGVFYSKFNSTDTIFFPIPKKDKNKNKKHKRKTL